MQYTEYSVAEFRDLVDAARTSVDQMLDEATRQADEQLQAAGERVFRYMQRADAIRAAQGRYVEAVQLAAASFLSVCDELLSLQEGYDAEVDQACGLMGAAPGQGLASDAGTVAALSAKVREMASGYADRIEEVQVRYVTAWNALANERDAQLDLFTSVVAQECGVLVETLDSAVHTALHTGEMAVSAAYSGAKGAAIAMVVATAVGVAGATVAVSAAGSAATAIWNYFATPVLAD
ncbi:hypothetical protein [Streptomyces sp. NPDC001594]|uniref:hypothetical protein n=1 Tax=Streptomyces sp. NPDC001594 TaxID=3364590 RepID=UPI00367B5F68